MPAKSSPYGKGSGESVKGGGDSSKGGGESSKGGGKSSKVYDSCSKGGGESVKGGGESSKGSGKSDGKGTDGKSDGKGKFKGLSLESQRDFLIYLVRQKDLRIAELEESLARLHAHLAEIIAIAEEGTEH